MLGSIFRINPLNRKLLRDLWKFKGQVIAVTAVILCGITTYVCMSSVYRNLKLTRDTYYQEYRLADFWIPLERAPETAAYKLAGLDGVTRVRSRIVQDVNVDVEGDDSPKIGRLVTMPDVRKAVLNDIHIVSGHYFSNDALDEVILSDRFAKENNLGVGDTIQASMNSRKETLRIVGTALSPEYVYMIRNAQEFIPNDSGFGVLYVKETFAEMLGDMGGACNEIIGTVDDREKLDVIFDRAKKMLKPYGVLATIKRHDQISNRYISDEIKNLGVSAKIEPSIFLGIAALILMIMLARMVKRERTEIGVLKAYGYSNAAIMAHYLKFALVISVAGWLGGVGVGMWLGRGMIVLYQDFYQFPLLRYRFYWDVIAIGLLIGAISGTAGASVAAFRVLQISPATAMRPEAPRLGGAILLERIEWLWRRISFSWKMIIRNISRYKLRAAFTVVGVALSGAILIVGWFTNDCMDWLMDYQFTKMQRQDMKVTFIIERGEGAIRDLRQMKHVRAVEPLFEYPFEVRTRWREKELLITGVPADSKMYRLTDTEGRPVDLSGTTLVLNERTAKQLGVTAGDTVEIEPMIGKVDKVRTVTVGRPVKLYLGMGAYMNLDALSRLMNEDLVANAAMLRVDRGTERIISRELKDVPAIASVGIQGDFVKAFDETLAESMAIMNGILITFAFVIAFAIIYNTTAITLTERSRELASLRVLGFTLPEVRQIVFDETWVLAIFGAGFGVLVGLLLCKWLVMAFNTELYRLPFYIDNMTLVASVVTVLLFVALTNLLARRRIRKLDMVEVLKSRE